MSCDTVETLLGGYLEANAAHVAFQPHSVSGVPRLVFPRGQVQILGALLPLFLHSRVAAIPAGRFGEKLDRFRRGGHRILDHLNEHIGDLATGKNLEYDVGRAAIEPTRKSVQHLSGRPGVPATGPISIP